MNFREFFSHLTHQKRYSENTILAYQNDLDGYKEYLALTYDELSPVEATHQVIRSWILSLMESGITNSSVKRKISCLRSYYKFLLSEGALKVSPMQKITAPKTGKKLPQFVKEEEMRNLLSEISFESDFKGLRDQLIIEILYQTGIRVSELINITLKDVDLVKQSISVIGKRNKQRIIPISENLRNNIQSYRVQRTMELGDNCPSLLVTNSDKKLYRKFVYNKVNYYLNLVSSLSKKSPHVLRHTFATHMLKNGADLNAIKDLLGHANLAATQVYAHNTLEQLKSVHKMAHPRN